MSSTTKKKFVEQELSEDYSIPSDNQQILKIVKPKGNNLHQVITSSGEEHLASMPSKFRKTIWVKRGDYVVAEPITEGQKVKFEIVRILQKDQVKYYTKVRVWPEGFLLDSHINESRCEQETIDHYGSNSDSEEEKADFVVCNPNKHMVSIESDDSSSESDEPSSKSDRPPSYCDKIKS